MMIFQKHDCATDCQCNGKVHSANNLNLNFYKIDSSVELFGRMQRKCRNCKTKITKQYRFNQTPYLLFIESMNQDDFISLNVIPET